MGFGNRYYTQAAFQLAVDELRKTVAIEARNSKINDLLNINNKNLLLVDSIQKIKKKYGRK
jgi:hypothetical protein